VTSITPGTGAGDKALAKHPIMCRVFNVQHACSSAARPGGSGKLSNDGAERRNSGCTCPEGRHLHSRFSTAVTRPRHRCNRTECSVRRTIRTANGAEGAQVLIKTETGSRSGMVSVTPRFSPRDSPGALRHDVDHRRSSGRDILYFFVFFLFLFFFFLYVSLLERDQADRSARRQTNPPSG